MHTLRTFLRRALKPVGHTMYVWGGGWNQADSGAGAEACALAPSPRWARFAARQGADYDWHDTRYCIHDGLDCSGFVGWAVYGVFAACDGCEGYVMPAARMAADFAARGWGCFTPAPKVHERQAGDVLSTQGHVYLSLGDCADGSALFVHASPPGVQLGGSPAPDGTPDSQAVALARAWMRAYCPDWYARFPQVARPMAYVTEYDRFRWSACVLPDPDGVRGMDARAVLGGICNTDDALQACPYVLI